MSTTGSKGFLARLGSLFSGMFHGWVREKEHEKPQVVYEQAILERKRQYGELKQAVAGILYMRNKLEGEIEERRMEIARLHDDIQRAVRNGRDNLSLTLIARKQEMFEELERAEKELQGIREEAAEAKDNLLKFREEIEALIHEKGRMIAKLANVQTRRRLRTALDNFSVDDEMAALENVREHIEQIAVTGQLEREVEDTPMRRQLHSLRKEARVESARAELSALKQKLGENLIPETAEKVLIKGTKMEMVPAK